MPPRSRHAPMEAHLDACSLEAGRRSPNRADTRPRLGLVAGDLTNPRPAGHTVVTLEAQLLGSRFCVGRHSNIDEISHLGSPRLECCQQARDPNAPTAMPPVTGVIAPSDNISRQWRKESIRIGPSLRKIGGEPFGFGSPARQTVQNTIPVSNRTRVWVVVMPSRPNANPGVVPFAATWENSARAKKTLYW
jgi:hypothetical protein